MASGRDRFARQQLEQRARALDAVELPVATVTAVQAGASLDGIALATVDYLGASLKVPYLTSYTPVVGHVVAMTRHAGNWLILGRPGGFPPLTGGS